jgi:hypothetical protein
MDVENDFDEIDSSNGEMANKKEAQLGPNQAHLQEDKSVDTNNLMNDTCFPILPSHNEEVLEINDSVEDEPSDIPQFIGGESSTTRPQKQGSTRNNEGIAGTFERSDEDGNSIGDESVGGDDGSVISEIFQPILPKKRKRHVDEDTSVSSSSTSRSQKQASVRAKNGTASTPQRTGEDEDDGNVKSGMSVLKPSEHVEESSTRPITTSISSLKARGGLPPRPPKETSKDPKRRITRSKKTINDELPAQAKRSTRSATRKLSSGAKAPKQKTKYIANDDDASVQTNTSTRSTRSAAKKLSSDAKAPKQKTTEIESDDVSVQTNTSTRSTKSAARKVSSGAKAPKQKTKEIENDDDVSVQTNTSARSTRSAAGKLSSGVKAPKQKTEAIENDDDISVQTTTSARSTRSAARKLSSVAKAPKQKTEEIENDDDLSVQTNASTRSATIKLSSGATRRTTEEPAEDNDPYSHWTVKKLQLELKRRKILYSTKLRKKELKERLKSADEAKKRKNPM